MNAIKLTINKRELDFTFGLGFLGELLEALDMDIENVVVSINKNPFKIIPALMFHSASYAKKRKGQKVDFTLYDLTDWIEEDGGIGNNNVVDFCNAFNESLMSGVPQEQETTDKAPKKK